jgi:hypothetical protein
MTRESAIRKLAGDRGMLRRWLGGELLALAEVYIPYRLYEITIQDRGRETRRYHSVDAATGTLDPYEFPAPLEPENFVALETRNFHPALLDDQHTRELAIESVQRALFSKGFFRVTNPGIHAHLLDTEFYVPYWAGFCGREQNLNLVVLNAVRQTYEGSKLRRLVQSWLIRDSGCATLQSSVEPATSLTRLN